MMFRLLLLSAVVLFTSAGCQTPYEKKDEEERKPMKDQSGDQAFQSFLGRLRTAVARKDRAMLASLMTQDFGYRWDPAPAGETAFDYWDRNNLWPQLEAILQEQFVPNDRDYMVAPPQVMTDPAFSGFRAGMRIVVGSWKFAYFVPGEEVALQ